MTLFNILLKPQFFTFQSDHKDPITNIIMFLLSHICAYFNGVRVYILKPRLPVFP